MRLNALHSVWLLVAALLVLLVYLSAQTLSSPSFVNEENWRTYVDLSFGESIKPERDVTNIVITVVWFDTLDELRAKLDDPAILGQAHCDAQVVGSLGHCDLYLVRPELVDDEWVNTLGHEVLHGLYGNYHD